MFGYECIGFEINVFYCCVLERVLEIILVECDYFI